MKLVFLVPARAATNRTIAEKSRIVGRDDLGAMLAPAERKTAWIVVGPFGKECTPAAVVALLQPLVGDLELVCFEKP